ncbi:Protein SDE [Ananas comosus]|uniref:Protein SDE n=1 Tax=Ananas comosus TaxID=4615 RepID=A0A199W1G8_ANACO|nr:Protein SDE [Ananas comosus]
MAIYQMLVRFLDGTTQCLQFPSPTISGEALKRDLVARSGVPLGSLRVVTGSREIGDGTLISASGDDGLFPSCALLLRLRGGKGGFGSLLRGAATKAGQKKTSNFDACRDMSGRRLRHVNAEKKLEEWKAEAEERRLEKLAEQFLRKKAKEVQRNSSTAVDKYLEKFREDAEKCVEEVEESVRESFQRYKESKRKLLPVSEPSLKRLKIWMGKQNVEESDSDEDGDDDEEDDGGDGRDEKSVVLDEGNCSDGLNKVEDGSSDLDLVSGSQSEGDSSGADSKKSALEVLNGNCGLESSEEAQDSGSGDDKLESDGSVEAETVAPDAADAQNRAVSISQEVPEENNSNPEMENVVQPELLQKELEVDGGTETGEEGTGSPSLEEPLNLSTYNSAAELEAFGMERLKTELQTRGLKCGGTLQERASRLFLLKTTPIEKLPKKVLARPVTGGK